MSNLKFAETHNLVAFLEKPEESDGFEGIIDFLNASSIRYALTIQALVDGKKVIVTETSVRRALQLKDAEAFFSPQWKFLIHIILQCLSPKTTAWNEFSSIMASAVICLATNQKFNFSKYIFDNMVKNLEGGVKFLMYPRFVQVFLDKLVEGITKHKEIYVTPSYTKKVFANMKRGGKGFSGRKKQPRRKERKDTEVPQPSGSTEPITDETANAEHVPTYSNDLFFSGEDRLKLNELMELCTKLSERVLDLENTKTSQAVETAKLKERVKKLERGNKLRTSRLKRLREVGRSAQVVSYEDKEVTLVDEAQGRNDDYLMFDTRVFHEQEVEIEKAISNAEVTTVSATTITVDELNLAQTLINIKAAKPKAITTTATITTTAVTRPKARGVVVQEPNQINVELEEEDRLAKQREEDENITKLDYVQAMIDVGYELAARLQAQEQEELTVEEKSKLFIELMDKRKKHFARLRAKEQRRKPPTQAQKEIKCKEKDEGSVTRAEESSSKRASTELEQERIKKQKIDDDQEEAKMKKHMEIVVDEKEITVNAIPIVTKPLIIVDWKIIKEGKIGNFQLIRADGSSRRYSSMIKILQNINRKDLKHSGSWLKLNMGIQGQRRHKVGKKKSG
ncbi:hypothetical protein Tco_0152279 [Tanacetum coccineum]